MTVLTLSALQYGLGVLIALCVLAAVKFSRRNQKVPPNLPILKVSSGRGEADCIEAFKNNGAQVIQQGYEQYSKKGKNYLLRTPQGLDFVVAPCFIEEIRTAPESILSGLIIENDIMQTKYTIHHLLDFDSYEFDVVRKQLTHNLGPSLRDIVDECHQSFVDEIKEPKEWTSIHMWPICQRIVTRTANRQLFGETLAANNEFLQLSIDFTYLVFGGAHIIRDWPALLRPLILRLKTGISHHRMVAEKHLIPLLENRIHNMQEAKKTGSTEEFQARKPKDAVQWVLDITPPEKLDVKTLVYRMLHISVAAIHTSSISYLNTLYDLAQRPEIHEELREEIVSVMAEEGDWTIQGLAKMVKLDSFMKESARWHPFVAGSLERMAMQDFKLSDGSIITKGTKVTVPHYAISFDEKFYGSNVDQFDAFRFSKLRAKPGEEKKHSLVQCGPTFTHFGYGKRACPGRYFASNEIKVLLVYTLSMFEIRFPKDQAKPSSVWTGGYRSSDMSLNVEWKRRDKPLLRLDQLVKKTG